MTIFYDVTNQPHELPAQTEVHWRIAAYIVIRNNLNNILMVKTDEDGNWDFPGGGIEIDETIKQGLDRELMEETGFSAIVTDTAPFYITEGNLFMREDNKYYHTVCLFYRAQLASEIPDTGAIQDSELTKNDWISLDSITSDTCRPFFWPVIQYLQKM